MTRKERYSSIVAYFIENMPSAQSELHFRNSFELLIAVVLSAQCTDRRVNMVTPELFASYPDPQTLSEANFDEVFPYVKSISYPNSKCRHIIELSAKLCSSFGGEVPSYIEKLMSLPGVGRKTANVIASIVYDKPVIAVDTHVFRVAHRMGLSNGKTPEAVEKDLEKNIPEQYRAISHHWLILHGRYICTARSPKCETELKDGKLISEGCPFRELCPEYLRRAIHREA